MVNVTVSDYLSISYDYVSILFSCGDEDIGRIPNVHW